MAKLKIGNKAPDFELPGVVVIFSCNHCPTVKAYEDRMVAIQRDYEGKEEIRHEGREMFPPLKSERSPNGRGKGVRA